MNSCVKTKKLNKVSAGKLIQPISLNNSRIDAGNSNKLLQKKIAQLLIYPTKFGVSILYGKLREQCRCTTFLFATFHHQARKALKTAKDHSNLKQIYYKRVFEHLAPNYAITANLPQILIQDY